MKTFTSIHPYDQRVVAEYPALEENALGKRLDAAAKAFEQWRKTPLQQRSDVLKRIAEQFRTKKEELAHLITLEMGKIYTESLAEIEKCALCCDFYAENALEYIHDELLHQHKPTDMQRGKIVYEPLGAIFAIMPWNYPFWQVIRFAAPSLMAGNVVLLKHAPNVVGCALILEKIFSEAALALDTPENIVQVLAVDVDVVECIIAHDAVQGVTLTGSEYAGSSVAALAGRHIKRSVLELGGSDPLIVLCDADLDRAATVAVQSRMQNAGQSCIAAKRFLVERAVYDDFVQRCYEKIAALKQGDPFNSATTTAPMARVDLAEKLHTQLCASQAQGGMLLTGGSINGANFEPALLVDAPQASPAFQEETFGPLAVIVRVESAEEAVTLANASRYGLGASVWTSDIERGEMLARQIRAGAVYVNGLVKSMPQLPFGGIKKSGYGRELSYFGMKEFMNAKTIYVYSSEAY